MKKTALSTVLILATWAVAPPALTHACTMVGSPALELNAEAPPQEARPPVLREVGVRISRGRAAGNDPCRHYGGLAVVALPSLLAPSHGLGVALRLKSGRLPPGLELPSRPLKLTASGDVSLPWVDVGGEFDGVLEVTPVRSDGARGPAHTEVLDASTPTITDQWTSILAIALPSLGILMFLLLTLIVGGWRRRLYSSSTRVAILSLALGVSSLELGMWSLVLAGCGTGIPLYEFLVAVDPKLAALLVMSVAVVSTAVMLALTLLSSGLRLPAARSMAAGALVAAIIAAVLTARFRGDEPALLIVVLVVSGALAGVPSTAWSSPRTGPG